MYSVVEYVSQEYRYKKMADPKVVDWKNFMSEVLIRTEFSTDEKIEPASKYFQISPNTLMDTRHAMARVSIHSRKSLTPKEIVQTEAARSVREENRKILLKRKHEMLVRKEIEALSNLLEHYKLVRKKEEVSNEANCYRRKSAPKIMSHHVNLERNYNLWNKNFRRKVETSSGKFPAAATELIIKDNEISFEFGAGKPNEQITNIYSRPVSRNRKGSVTNSENEIYVDKEFLNDLRYKEFFEYERDEQFLRNHTKSLNGLEGKTKVIEKQNNKSLFLKIKTQTNEKYYSKTKKKLENDEQKIEWAWRAWRMYTMIKRKNRREKIEHHIKIEKFLEQLQEKSQNEVPLKKINFNTVDKRLKMKSFLVLSQSERQEKEKNVLNIMRDVEKSKRQTYECLVAFEKQKLERKEKVKALKTLSNVREEIKDTIKVYPYPKFLLRMEKRREEQINRRTEIKERKRKIDEKRKLEKKQREYEAKAALEKAKRDDLEKLKAKRRIEEETKQKKIKEREKAKRDSQLADEHYRKFLIRKCGLEPWLNLLSFRKYQWNTAVEFDKRRCLKKTLNFWKDGVRDKMENKLEKAKKLYHIALQRNCLSAWIKIRDESIKKYQAAADWYEFRLADKMFITWVGFTREQHLENLKKTQAAELHCETKLKIHYLKVWRNYPTTKRLEIAKEKRKQAWRELVQEVLSDYRPEFLGRDS